jgi:cytidine deaminase
MDIDWDTLRAAAVDAMHGAYAPYSRFPVGAAALVDDGRIVRGCNVENASYGLTLCAECGIVSALHASGGGRLVALSCVDASGEPLMPCGRCRQLLWEHGGPRLFVDASTGPLLMSELLPYAFDERDLERSDTPADVTPHQARPAPTAEPAPHLRDMIGLGTVFVHPDNVAGTRMWTGYWDGSSGQRADASDRAADRAAGAAPAEAGQRASAEQRAGSILDEAPSRTAAADVIAWGLARTRRVIVVDAEGEMFWAGEGPAPTEVPRRWATQS